MSKYAFKCYLLKLRYLPIYLQVTFAELIVVSNHFKLALHPIEKGSGAMYINMIMPVYYTVPIYYRSKNQSNHRSTENADDTETTEVYQK